MLRSDAAQWLNAVADQPGMDDFSFPDDAPDDADRASGDDQHDWGYDDGVDDRNDRHDDDDDDRDRSYVDHLVDHGYYDTDDTGTFDHDTYDREVDGDGAVDGLVPIGRALRRAVDGSLGRSLRRSPDDPPLEMTAAPGSLYAAYEGYARSFFDRCAPIAPAEVVIEMTGLRLGPHDRELVASLVCARVADGAVSGIDPSYRALASLVIATRSTTGMTDGLAGILDPSFVTLAGNEWARCAGARLAEEHPEICQVQLREGLAELLEPLYDEAVRTAVLLRACHGGYRLPRSLPEAAIAGLGVFQRNGCCLGRTSVASLLLLGTGATPADLPRSSLGYDPGETAESDEPAQDVWDWHEELQVSLVEEILDTSAGDPHSDTDTDTDNDEEQLLHRIGLLGLVLSHRPARRAELEALLGSLAWLFDLHVISASRFISRRDAEVDRAREKRGELEHPDEDLLADARDGNDADGGRMRSRSCSACSEPAGTTGDTGAVVLARDRRLCLDVLVAHLVRPISAEGAVLGVYDRSVLSRLVVAAVEQVSVSMQLCSRFRLELATGELLRPSHNERGARRWDRRVLWLRTRRPRTRSSLALPVVSIG